ncbi:MAG: hypothetical protein ACK5GV_12130 [Bacteroidota bacterium]
MQAGKISLIVLCSIIAITAFAFVYPNRQGKEQTNPNQDPQYLIEARKNVIGVWYDVESPLDVVEFTQDGRVIYRNKELITEKLQDGTIVHRNHDLPEGRATYKIVNTTPICESNVYVNESKKTMFLVETDDDGFESCYYFWIGVDDDNKPALTTSGVGANGNSQMSYRKK